MPWPLFHPLHLRPHRRQLRLQQPPLLQHQQQLRQLQPQRRRLLRLQLRLQLRLLQQQLLPQPPQRLQPRRQRLHLAFRSQCKRIRLVVRSRLTELLTVRHRCFLGCPVQIIALAQHPRRTVARGCSTSGFGWSDSGAISHTVAPTVNKTYTANFRTQYYLTMNHGTGGTVTPASGWKTAGATTSITATPTNNNQVSYSFAGWTGSGPGSYSGPNNPSSIRMNGPITENASFTQNNVQVIVQTNPVGRTFTVDGTTYTTSQTFSWQPGSSHTIATTSPQSGGTGVRYVWSNWTGGGTISHTVAPAINATYTANFSTQYYLTMSHGTGGTVSPMSGWKGSGSAVSIRAIPASGYNFSNWIGSGSGSYSGSNNPALITMNGPTSETATFTHN